MATADVPVDEHRQTTLKRPVSVSGIALHTGERIHMRVLPADADQGIVFCRTDLPDQPKVRASLEHVTDTRRATTICDRRTQVHTTEHLLAALFALGVDNAEIQMDGAEPPVADGSAAEFTEALREAEKREQDAERKMLKIVDPVVFESGESILIGLPQDGEFRVSCTVRYNQSPLDCQYLSLSVTSETFSEELAHARTFCMYEEIEALMTADLIRGGSLDNAVVLKGDIVLSREGLRYDDEFVRHKILDLIGDLSLVGRRIEGHIVAVKPGHPSNIEFARRLVKAENGS